MKWFAMILTGCLVFALFAAPAGACNYGAAAVQRSYGYAYVQPAPSLLPSYGVGGGCDCGVAAAPLPAQLPAPVYATPLPSYGMGGGCGVAAAPLPSYGYGGVVAAQRTVVAGYSPSFAPVATPYYSAGVGYGVSRGVFAAPVRGYGFGVARGFGVGYGAGVVVAPSAGVIVAGRSRGVIVAPGPAFEVRRGLFGRTQIRFR